MNLSQLLTPSETWRRLARSAAALGLAAAVISGGGAAHAAPGTVALFVRSAPLPTLVPRAQVMVAAERTAALHEGDFVLRGTGRSMEPVYLAGTAVVVHPTAMHMLRKGMPVVYKNARGRLVTHMLLEKVGGGWRAIGLNNAEADDTLVTARNLVGVIKHAYAADDTSFPPEVAAQITLRRAPGAGIPIALLR